MFCYEARYVTNQQPEHRYSAILTHLLIDYNKLISVMIGEVTLGHE
jgi:hypothetical protein